MRSDGELYREPTQAQIVSEGLQEIKEAEFKELEATEKELRRKKLEQMHGKDVFGIHDVKYGSQEQGTLVKPKRTQFGTNYFNRKQL